MLEMTFGVKRNACRCSIFIVEFIVLELRGPPDPPRFWVFTRVSPKQPETGRDFVGVGLTLWWGGQALGFYSITRMEPSGTTLKELARLPSIELLLGRGLDVVVGMLQIRKRETRAITYKPPTTMPNDETNDGNRRNRLHEWGA